MKNKKIWKAVDKILWEDWDPIGLYDNKNLRDEYQSYVPSFVKLILENADQNKFEILLHHHSNINMGINSKESDYSKVVQKLINLTKH